MNNKTYKLINNDSHYDLTFFRFISTSTYKKKKNYSEIVTSGIWQFSNALQTAEMGTPLCFHGNVLMTVSGAASELKVTLGVF